jgi:hypothetical protein
MDLKTHTCLLLLAARLAAGSGQWVLATSTLTYRVWHPLRESEGFSHAAKGKGICRNGQCNFRIEVLIKSFESGDTDDDIQMIRATRGAQFPMVAVVLSLPEWALSGASFRCDVDIEFAGARQNIAMSGSRRQVPVWARASPG